MKPTPFFYLYEIEKYILENVNVRLLHPEEKLRAEHLIKQFHYVKDPKGEGNFLEYVAEINGE